MARSCCQTNSFAIGWVTRWRELLQDDLESLWDDHDVLWEISRDWIGSEKDELARRGINKESDARMQAERRVVRDRIFVSV